MLWAGEGPPVRVFPQSEPMVISISYPSGSLRNAE